MIAHGAISADVHSRDDRELMWCIQSGGVGAFEELYDRYSGRAYRVARSVCHDRATAEEAVQEVFTSVWRNRGAYRPERGSVAAWLLASVRYRAIDYVRRDRTAILGCAHAELLEPPPAPEDGTARVVDGEDAVRLRALLKKIPEPQREVITLAFYGELSHAEIAAYLQLPAGTIKGRMRLGLQKLKAEIDRGVTP